MNARSISPLVCLACLLLVAADGEPGAWTGSMEEGHTYRADVVYRGEMWWPEGLDIPRHHAVHVDWENSGAFALIPKQPVAGQRMKWTWKVLSKQVWQVQGRREWRTLFRCRILSAQGVAP